MDWNPNRCPQCDEPPFELEEQLLARAGLMAVMGGGFDYRGASDIFWDSQVPRVTAEGKQILCGPPPEGGLMSSFCVHCQGPKRRPHFYLCGYCWYRLPFETRELLWLRDGRARERLALLYQALRQGTRPEEIAPATVS